MPFSSGPNTVNDSIVFNFDIGDTTNSYKGEPTTNTVSTTSFNPLDLYTWASSGNTSTWARDTSINPSPVKGIALKEVSFGTDSYSGTYNSNTWNLGSAAVGQTWTVSVYALASPGTNLQIWLFGANSSGNYIELDAWSFAATGTWQRISGTRTLTNGSTVYVQARVATATNGATVWWDGLQMEQKTYTTSFTPTSRSTTQGLLDISGNSNTINLANMTYGANNYITFDGTDDYTDVTSNLGTLNQYTIEHVSYKGAENRMPISYRTNTSFYQYGDNSWFYTHGGVSGEYYYPKSFNINGWGHWVIVYNGAYVQIYRNGRYEGQQSTSGTANWTDGMRIGYWSSGGNYAWNGQIAIVKMYNRALTATEIRNNYLQYKTRFNLS